MIKKIFLLFAALIPFATKAQVGVGTWDLYSSFSSVSSMVETPSRLYYLSSGFLYSFDKETSESRAYSTNNILNDNNISFIRYNPFGKYLAVVYSNGNIDLIHDADESVTNLSDIKDAVLTVSPTVNDVAFSDGQLVAATNFGLVLFDDRRAEVKESGIYDLNVVKVAMTNDCIFYYTEKPAYKFYAVDKTDHLQNQSKATEYTGLPVISQLEAIDNDNLIIIAKSSTGLFRHYTLNRGNHSLTRVNEYFSLNDWGRYADGFYAFNDSEIFTFNTKDFSTQTVAIPSALQKNVVAMWKTPTLIWTGNSAGIGKYDIADGKLTVLTDRFVPESLTTRYPVESMALREGGILTWDKTRSKIFSPFIDRNSNSVINRISPAGIEDVTPDYKSSTSAFNASIGANIQQIMQSPTDPSVLYLASFFHMIYKMKDGEIVGHLQPANNGNFCTGVDYDSKGNIYARVNGETIDGVSTIVKMLPKEKTDKFENQEEWISLVPFSLINTANSTDASFVVCKKSNIVAFTFWWAQGFVLLDTKGTVSTADDKYVYLQSVTDQDGKDLDWDGMNFLTLAEDNAGNLWVGSPHGILQLSNLSAGIDNIRFTRVKVPRNDGTNYADYLLDGETIMDICPDSSNRKWIATNTNGVYLVSADGSQILEHYTMDNSPLPTNQVFTIECDQVSNAVYFGTAAGLVKYNSTAAPAAEDFSDVYAYPNPVRPEYTGWIVVKNLMDNSLVKIADAAGNVFFNGRSDGGMIAWDGCDANGNRVKTGVYFVFASSGSDASQPAGAAVTKILVVN